VRPPLADAARRGRGTDARVVNSAAPGRAGGAEESVSLYLKPLLFWAVQGMTLCAPPSPRRRRRPRRREGTGALRRRMSWVLASVVTRVAARVRAPPTADGRARGAPPGSSAARSRPPSRRRHRRVGAPRRGGARGGGAAGWAGLKKCTGRNRGAARPGAPQRGRMRPETEEEEKTRSSGRAGPRLLPPPPVGSSSPS